MRNAKCARSALNNSAIARVKPSRTIDPYAFDYKTYACDYLQMIQCIKSISLCQRREAVLTAFLWHLLILPYTI